MAEFVTVDRSVEQGIAVLRIARPPLNLIDLQVALEVAAAAEEIGNDPGISAVIVYGDERVFSAGDEMAELADLTPEQAEAIVKDFQQALGALAKLPQPTVAAISGYALGAGLELALGADHRIIGDNVKLGLPQIKAGLIPLAGIRRLSLLVGPSKAKDLVYSGRFVDPKEAERIGLVDEVVAPDDVFQAALRWARQFTGAPTLALAAAKRVFEAGTHGHDRARTEWVRLFGTEDQQVGTRSYLDNGPGVARFTGR
ncbi:enoyl-CoA hydratase-related protein [Nocardia yamanashiensis]|uniref:enoyl-CoA hydratase-related protein n=1 Tax=Nocardia yamanashiensis TaxID=209247 RepID=UPI001E385F91|nr:enoyl-CoA hydratase-related protein [Nocardia yamanashiensis]UGT41875.1 enoyl-CoA hydratase-related protein [Nocardia yamanashiensis]